MSDTPLPLPAFPPSSLELSEQETFSYSKIDYIDQICDRYKRALVGGLQPKIEDYISRIEPADRDQLLRSLTAIDYAFRRHDGGQFDFGDYLKRFPESHAVLLELHAELQLSIYQPPDALAANTTGDVDVALKRTNTFSHFCLLEIAGSGGYGTVWRAIDLKLNREVALKIPRSDRMHRKHLAALLREAQAAAKLKHPNIIPVHDVSEENGISFIVTDYIHGTNLKIWRQAQTLHPLEVARLIVKIALAVQHAHDKGVVHRDLKLSNVLIDEKGEPHIGDFGLAVQEASDDLSASDGEMIGTPAYMAPEQVRADHRAIDRRTDVYSMGVMLYEMLTGTTPFRGNVKEVLQQILDVPPIAPRLINRQIPKDLDSICLKCLAKASAQRYSTAQELVDDLQLFLNGETLRGIPAALPTRLWKRLCRNRRLIAFTSVVMIVAASLSAGLMGLRSQAPNSAIPLYPVVFTTQPPGCELTLVGIDPETGEPDPTRIQTASGRTPLTMPLASGEYLVVAVLNSHRFHEVHRHVPEPNENRPFKYRQLTWTKRRNGVIEMPVITIPPPDLLSAMARCEGTDQIAEPRANSSQPVKKWRIPAFYVDRKESSIDDLRASEIAQVIIDGAGRGPLALLNVYESQMQMELVGKRLPSAAELFYLATIVCPDFNHPEQSTNACLLPDQSRIEGVHSNVWEWTSTKPGGPFSGMVSIPKSLGTEALSHVVGCGDVHSVSGELPERSIVSQSGFISLLEQLRAGGIRGVRSAVPRRTPRILQHSLKMRTIILRAEAAVEDD